MQLNIFFGGPPGVYSDFCNIKILKPMYRGILKKTKKKLIILREREREEVSQ